MNCCSCPPQKVIARPVAGSVEFSCAQCGEWIDPKRSYSDPELRQDISSPRLLVSKSPGPPSFLARALKAGHKPMVSLARAKQFARGRIQFKNGVPMLGRKRRR